MITKIKDFFIAILALSALSAFLVGYSKLAAWWLEKTIRFFVKIINHTRLFKK